MHDVSISDLVSVMEAITQAIPSGRASSSIQPLLNQSSPATHRKLQDHCTAVEKANLFITNGGR